MKRTADGLWIPALPNWFPYNELLLSGKLSAKTREWRWGHTGPTLLYTSVGTADEVARAHKLDPKEFPRRVLVGIGDLVPVRVLTEAEVRQIEREFGNGRRLASVWAGVYRYEFRNLRRFAKPIPFTPPRGAVRTFRVPTSVVASAFRSS